MTGGESPSNAIGEADFWSSVIKIEMEHWGNDIVGIKAVLMALSCTAQKAEAAGSSPVVPAIHSHAAARLPVPK